MLHCIQYDLTSEEALGKLLRTRCSSRGLNDFIRIELALDLEPHFQEKALTNRQAGGKSRGSSKWQKFSELIRGERSPGLRVFPLEICEK
jgi:hypothetical protein